MGMAYVQFYRNKYNYPHYSQLLVKYGDMVECTPRGVNLRGGSIHVAGDMEDFMSCNYLSFERDGEIIYAWIDNVTFRTANSFEVSYNVDPWRTYKDKVLLGNQFIARHPDPTYQPDKLLGSVEPYPLVLSKMFSIGQTNKRVFVVQVRAGTGEIFSRSPVNPTPYQFFMKTFDINNWTADSSLDSLMTLLSSGAETQNIVTMYSIPWMDISSLPEMDLPVRTAEDTKYVSGFRFLGDNDPTHLLHNETDLVMGYDVNELFRVPHSVQLVIPEAGIINIPDELLVMDNLKLRQDIDLFSGACNYMLMSGDNTFYGYSARGSSISSIPIVSDPYDTYMSQNQNALATSLIGDVATIAGGVGATVMTGGAGAAVGGQQVFEGVKNIIDRQGQIADATSRYSNPPAFLGTALVSNFNQKFWVVTTKQRVDNDSIVHTNFGYPVNRIAPLTFPTSGFIQTEGCAVMTTDGSVPRWAINEINNMFNNGILVHA